MKKTTTLLVALLCVAAIGTAQISGTVFKDFNFDGVRNTGTFPEEPFVYGVNVRAFNAANSQLGATKTTDVNGAFNFTLAEIPAGTAVRLEFTPLAGTFVSRSGLANSSDVQFVTAPSAVVSLAITSQKWYSTTNNPYMATVAGINGNPNGGGTAGTAENLHVFPYQMGNGTPDDGGATRRLPNSQTGSSFAVAFQRSSRTLFTAAYLKRHAGFGPGGIGGIYKTQISSAGIPAPATLLVDVNTLSGINVGTDPRTVALPATSATRNTDAGVFALVGKRGIGGMDLSSNGANLYFVNMYEKKVHRIAVGNPLKTTIVSADVTGTWIIPDPSIAGTVWHPMACKFANGKVYVGGVTAKEQTTNFNLATDTVGLRGFVYELDPTTGVFTQVLAFGLSHRRGFANNDGRYPFKANWWCGWQNNGDGGPSDPLRADYNTAGAGGYTGGIYYPQPMLSDIEFDVDGSMILAIRDRFGDQVGYQNLLEDGEPTTAFPTNNYFRGLTSGEVLRAGKNIAATTYTLEANGSVTTNGVATTSDGLTAANPAIAAGAQWSPTVTGNPWGGRYGPGWSGTAGTIPPGGPNSGNGTSGGYFYYNHNFETTGAPATLNNLASGAIAAHYMKGNGSIALLHGSGEVIQTAMDPVITSYANGAIRMANSGVQAGNMTQRIQLTATVTGTPGDPTYMGKANGLGDIECLTDAQPVQVGNRIWNDLNGNGIQDANETGAGVAAGTTVTLRSPGINGLYGDVDDQTWTTTTDAAGNYYFSALASNDNRKPASWIGTGQSVLPGFAYRIELTLPAGFKLSIADAVANGFDNIDNDATLLNATTASVTFTVNNTTHNFDFGLSALAAVGERVWRDDGSGGGTASNGLQDGTEPGVAGVTVTLYNAAGTTVLGSSITDAYGNYYFDNLTPATYVAGFTLPANYVFTTQTNTADDNLNTAPSTTGSDVIVTTGRTYPIVLSAGEANRNIDAGIIFTTPVVSQSVGDRVWFDNGAGGGTAGNGTQDGNEPGIAGITVGLYNSSGTLIATTITDAKGNYLFSSVTPGTGYTLGFTLPAGMTFTPNNGAQTITTNSDVIAATGKTAAFNVTAGTDITYLDAGLILAPNTTASLGDRVFYDANSDGIQQGSTAEAGIPGVVVNLYFDTNGDGAIVGAEATTPFRTATTDGYGNYLFTNLATGKYLVEFVKPSASWTISTSLAGANRDIDSDPNPGTGRTNAFTIAAGARITSVDAGMYLTTSPGTLLLGDRAWVDYNSNGIQDAGEPGIAGITVRLFRNGADGLPGTTDDVAVSTTFTDVSGNYIFTNVAASTTAATYCNILFANIPNGFSVTTKNASGSTAANDNNANSALRTGSIILTANDLTVDFGVVSGRAAGRASIGNKVFVDIDGDGVQEANELGVKNVTVSLYFDANADGVISGTEATTAFQTTATDALGNYLFSGLNAGTYQIGFSNLPAGYTVTARDAAAATDETDSDVSTSSPFLSGVYTLATGQEDLSVDLGLIVPAATYSLGGQATYDRTADGLKTGDPAARGVMVTLYNNAGAAIDYTTTDADGNYLFTGLAAGSYSVDFSNLPAGFDLTAQTTGTLTGSDPDRFTGRTPTVALSAGNPSDKTLDAGLISTRAALGNFVWSDKNGNGAQDAGEPGIAGIAVTLYGADGTTVISSAVTDANGMYLFANLTAGSSYVVGYSNIASNTEFTVRNAPGDNGNDTNSDADPGAGANLGKTAAFALAANETDFSADAGIRVPQVATVGDFVWADLDTDGIQDAGEPGVAGMLVTLYNSGGVAIGSAITNGNGYYLFTNVPPGLGYYVIISNLPLNPAAPQPVFTNQGVSTGVNTSHVNAAGQSHPFDVLAGTNTTNIDAGIRNTVVTNVVALRRLTATATLRGNTSNLRWVTEGETGTVRFEAERSIDGTVFTNAGDKAAVGGNTANNYLLNDDISSVALFAVIYYRVKAIDANGNFTYSNVVSVHLGKAVNVTVWPNPFAETVTIDVYSDAVQEMNIRLFDETGRTVRTQSVKASTGSNRFTLSGLNTLPQGNYVLKIISANGTESGAQKLVKR